MATLDVSDQKHNNFEPIITQILNISDFSVTSLCYRAQCGGGGSTSPDFPLKKKRKKTFKTHLFFSIFEWGNHFSLDPGSKGVSKGRLSDALWKDPLFFKPFQIGMIFV